MDRPDVVAVFQRMRCDGVALPGGIEEVKAGDSSFSRMTHSPADQCDKTARCRRAEK